jgi:hypothetical protein
MFIGAPLKIDAKERARQAFPLPADRKLRAKPLAAINHWFCKWIEEPVGAPHTLQTASAVLLGEKPII